MKQQIRNRHTGEIIWESEADDVRAAVIKAVVEGKSLAGANLTRANLTRAYLADANLAGANLTGAYLTDANLARAYLTGAYLTGANLTGAYLAGANLAGANLTRAYLAGANLTGAYLTDGIKIISLPLCIGPIGSRSATANFFQTDKGIHVTAGCFFGTLAEFVAKVQATHGTSQHAIDYLNACEFAKGVLAGRSK
jgi:hypothetical protein